MSTWLCSPLLVQAASTIGAFNCAHLLQGRWEALEADLALELSAGR